MILSAGQIHLIEETINASSISRTMMQENIVDHLCCLVEDKMKRGEPFDKAFNNALVEFAPNGLCEIERETYILLNFKSILMKKFVYSFALLSCIATSFGILFKILHLDGANLLLTFGMGGMAIFIPLLLFKPRLSVFDRAKNWFTMLSIFFLTGGTICKLLHLPGANLALMLGVTVFGLGFLPLYFVKMYRESVAS
jgi:hypothetical protein